MQFWIDNQAAIAWNNRRSSRNSFAQMLLRILALVEVDHNFFATAVHIEGVRNTMADAGSRIWQSEAARALFADMSCAWSQVIVPRLSRDRYRVWRDYCARGL